MLNSLQGSERLPRLRQELQLSQQGGYQLYDPLRHRFFQLGREHFLLLSLWSQCERADQLLSLVAARYQAALDLEIVQRLWRFLSEHELLVSQGPQARQLLLERQQRQRSGWLAWLLRNYLFMRFPLVRPDRWLSAVYPRITHLFAPALWAGLALLTLLGLWLVSRQWDLFLGSFTGLLNWQGALLFLLVLGTIKIAHELGHAFTAKHYGLRVPTMGVALMVLWPVLYTDATDAWRLPQRRARLLIGAAGVLVEMALAALACLLWSFLPPGLFKSICFIVATTTWVGSLLINLNPFMRFDGYYLLCDLWGIPNLQPRSFAYTRWWLRRQVLGAHQAAPETWAPGQERWIVCYALLTWLYRLALYVGIALLVYHYTFKLLGIVLFVAELYWFIARPIWAELRHWKAEIVAMSRTRRNGYRMLAVTVLLLLVLPWQQSVELPAVLQAQAFTRFYPAQPAQLQQLSVQEGERVAAGQVLLQLQAPELDYQLAQAEREMASLQQQLQRHSTSTQTVEYRQILMTQLAAARQRMEGLQAQRDTLAITAPFAGQVRELGKGLQPGRWLAREQPLLLLVDDQHWRIDAYVDEQQLPRLAIGQQARFYPELPGVEAVNAEVSAIDLIDARQWAEPLLASRHGGEVAVRQLSEGHWVSEQTLYRVRLTVVAEGALAQAQRRGVVVIEADRAAPLQRLWRSVAAVLVRESGW